jgi:predicted enzyme related to lactoylglutathione lyase
MKRFHVHTHVDNLQASIAFYSKLFAAAPTRVESDYAKWMLEDPRVNFAISATGRVPGVDHLGLQADDAEGLAALGHRLVAAGGAIVPEEGATCCYARSDKAWTEDPQGTRWETFHTFGRATSYYQADTACGTDNAACAAPAPMASAPATSDAQPTSCGSSANACCPA